MGVAWAAEMEERENGRISEGKVESFEEEEQGRRRLKEGVLLKFKRGLKMEDEVVVAAAEEIPAIFRVLKVAPPKLKHWGNPIVVVLLMQIYVMEGKKWEDEEDGIDIVILDYLICRL